MAFDEIMAQISQLLRDMGRRPENRHELYLALWGKLNEIGVMGMSLPAELDRFETEPEAELSATRSERSNPAPPRRHRGTQRP